MKRMWLVPLIGAVLVFGVLAVFLSGSPDLVETEAGGHEPIPIESVPSGHWEELGRINVFFGHQSVGRNVIDGLSEILNERPDIKLSIVESTDIKGMEFGNLFHANIGQNTLPLSKIESFSETLIANQENPPNIALAKFCYVDLMAESDPVALFEAYRTAMDSLKHSIPETVIVHVTIPIESAPRSVKSKIKARIKKAMRLPGVGDRNLVRHRYNEILRSAYEGREPIFDIARLEATDLRGFSVFGTVGSEKVPFMDAGHTTDGGHLNKLAGKRIAEQLLIVLANVASQTESPAT